MEYADYRWIFSNHQEKFRFYNVGDTHTGALSCDLVSLRKTVKVIASDPFTHWFGTGDYCEFINCDDKRFDPKNLLPRHRDNLDNLAISQADEWLEETEPMHEQCEGMVAGNHDDYIRKKYHIDILAYIVDRMNAGLKLKGSSHIVPNLGYGQGIVRVKFEREGGGGATVKSVVFNIAHGWGGGEYPGGNLNRMVRLSANDDADIFMRGHVHKMVNYLHPVFHYSRKGKLVAQKQSKALLICGSYYKTYQEGVTSYAEQRDYAPVETGSNWVEIQLNPFRMRVGSETTIKEQE
jgi:hypothetical protein